MPVYKDENKKSHKGQWYVSVRYKDWQGENKLKKKRGFDTQRQAKTWEREFLQKAKTDIDMTMKCFYELYESDIRPQVKQSTSQLRPHRTSMDIYLMMYKRVLQERKI